MELVLVRHGQTDDNLKKVLSGQFNSQLTQKGIEQAQAAAPRLGHREFDHIIVSDLQRARDTAANILGADRQVEYDMRIREKNFGELTHCTYAQLKAFRKNLEVHPRDDRPDQGESWNDLMNRTGEVYQHLVQTYYKQDKEVKILLVCHGGFIKEFLNYVRTQQGKPALSLINASENVSIHVIK